MKASIHGAVQGVGFRPYIFRLASELGLEGWVSNSVDGVFLEVEGPRADLETFLVRLAPEKPPRSFIQSLESSWLDPAGYAGFEIRRSETSGRKSALVLPDIATCPECLAEIFDPANRRYRYPFTNCTHCGPRFTIIQSLPYDRANTSMSRFTMCARCQAEYEDPRDRRFHAQPNACPECGPQLEFRPGGAPANAGENHPESPRPEPTVYGDAALEAAAAAIRQGRIVAVKGLGGFHLMVRADEDRAVRRLRELKHREEKPFALMFPACEAVKTVCELSALEERLLLSPEAPIVLLRRRSDPARSSNPLFEIADSVAPRNPSLGVMLPSNPLHHLLMASLGFPVVATSGNLSDEPICIDEQEARERLGSIADAFLVHDRPIMRHVDDSIVRVMLDREMVLRRARGYAPLPITLAVPAERRAPGGSQTPEAEPPCVLAVGAHLKNSVALSVGRQVFISQHIGDLETDAAFEAFRRVIADFRNLYDTNPGVIAADLHPDYLSTRHARELLEQPEPIVSRGNGAARIRPAAGRGAAATAGADDRPAFIGVQHHVAHVLSCMAENELQPPALGVAWDGTGYGLDGTVWGGEFFHVTETECRRVAHLRPFRLPGGDKAVREPRRAALGLLHEIFGAKAFEMAPPAVLREWREPELAALRTMLEAGLNSPRTTSAGRLFDGIAALAGLRERTAFEGQAAMELEFAIGGTVTDEAYPVRIGSRAEESGSAGAGRPGLAAPIQLDWAPLVDAVLADLKLRAPAAIIAAKFHNALAEAIGTVAQCAGIERVVLSGGCFQNRYLAERSVRRLREAGFRPYWHQRVPPNDGGIALGQIVAALRAST